MSTEDATDRRWKYPAIPSIIRKRNTRAPQDVIEKLAAHSASDVADVVGGMYTARGLRALYSPIRAVTGPAVTVKCPPGDNLGLKLALARVQPGDILVVDAQGFDNWCLGGFQMLAQPIRELGLRGLIVHGAYRDALEAKAAEFPIYAGAQAAWSGPKIGPFEINTAVCCGGVIVHPGDIVCADEDGIAIVPINYVDKVLARLGKRSTPATTNLAPTEDPYEAYLARLRTEGRVDERN